MIYLSVAKDYLQWHYTTAFADIFRIWRNYLWFVNHLFSVKDVLLTLFAPWRRLQEKTVNPLKDMEGFFSALTVNLLMRLVGIVIRLALLLIALVGFFFVIALGLLVFVAWIFAPFFFAHAFIKAIGLLFS